MNHWPGYKGYGFNLQSKKKSIGECYLTDIEPSSPSAFLGMKEYDRIMRVNGMNIDSVSHKEVSDMINSNPHSVELLIVDTYTLEYYATLGQSISSIPQETRTCSPIQPGSTHH